MRFVDLERLRHGTVFREPFPAVIVSDLLHRDDLKAVRRDFPASTQPGLCPLSELTYGPAFARLVDELAGTEVEEILSTALGIDLSPYPKMVSVRNRCRARDGQIHNDSANKVATAMLYLNDEWPAEGGQLRLLRGPSDLDDKVAEIAPVTGSFVAFRRTENSWHGHRPYEGPRRYVMINWMADDAIAHREVSRHRMAAKAKRLLSWR